MKIDWKSKLTSRKFWAAVAGFLTALMVACNFSSLTIEQVTAVVTAGGILIAYILGEGMVDKARAQNQGEQQQKGEEQKNDSLSLDETQDSLPKESGERLRL